MITIIPAADRHFQDFGWLKTYWLFSFDQYNDPANVRWGSLRVFNDDLIEAGQGFPTHPHREMEIVTIVLDGEITHEDSMGNRGVVSAGEVQRMSAGTGLTHSEFNLGDKPLSLYQIWIFPGTRGLEPSYDQKKFDPSLWAGKLYPVASGQGHEGAVTIHTDATIYRSTLDAGAAVEFTAGDDRKVFVYVTSGAVDISGVVANTKDQARIAEEAALAIRALDEAEFILIDIPA
jgi:redox-sensitive bicupin YhaK (pirin superfamily)